MCSKRNEKIFRGGSRIMEKLERCPLCGGEPELCKGAGEWYWIVCDCGIEFNPDDSSKKNVIEEWNNREVG